MEDLTRVTLDVDHMGHILVVLSEYHMFLIEHCAFKDEGNTQDDMETIYMLGNIEGRVLYNGLTVGDMTLVEDWEEELIKAGKCLSRPTKTNHPTRKGER